MPSWILWLSPVIVSPMLAIAWMSYATRPRGPVEAMETVEQYDRFRAALTSPVVIPEARPKPRSRARVSR